MDTTYKELTKVNKAIKTCDKTLKAWKKKQETYLKTKHDLHRKRSKAFLEYALKTGLKESPWKILFENEMGDITIKLMSDCGHFPKLTKQLGDDYFYNVELSKGVTLYVKDGWLDINFESPAKAKEFINKHELTIDFTDVVGEYELVMEQKETMDSFFADYGVTPDE